MEDQEFYKALGQALRYERKKKDIAQEYVAEQLNVTKMAISNYETGKRQMSAKALQQYCEVLGVSIQSVMDRAGV